MTTSVSPEKAGQDRPLTQAQARSVARWLLIVCTLIVIMVGVGGITRLTGSGLSIVEWKPILGTLPPLTPDAWNEAFKKYQAYPQFQISHPSMTLAEFKQIFFWEYFHRLLGRVIGFVFFVPLAVFHLRGLARPLSRRLLVGGILGGLQGALGWYMVKSGLIHEPHVSHYRLAAHLLAALLVLSYLLFLLFDLWKFEHAQSPARPVNSRHVDLARRTTAVLLGLLVLQIAYGAFTAGLHAGFAYNTWPRMHGEWIPSSFWALQPASVNLVANPSTVQFLHRTFAYLFAGGVVALSLGSRSLDLLPAHRIRLRALVAITLAQVLLGIATLLYVVPVALATLHQLGACATLIALLYLLHSLRSGRGFLGKEAATPLSAHDASDPVESAATARLTPPTAPETPGPSNAAPTR